VIRTGRSGDSFSPLVPLQSRGDEQPLFFVHQAGGNVMAYLRLARHLGTSRPFYGLQSRGLDGLQPPLDTIEAMATFYIDAIRVIQPHGPYHLGGHSLGGRVAFEMARQLEAMGEPIGLLAIVDVPGLDPDENAGMEIPGDTDALAQIVSQIGDLYGCPLDVSLGDLTGLSANQQYDLVLARMAQRRLLPPGTSRQEVKGYLQVYQTNLQAVRRYRPSPCGVDLTLIVSDELMRKLEEDPTLGWRHFTTGRVHVHSIPGGHMSMLKEPNVAALAARVEACLGE
jgi:thioesterase domain-containing protein